MLDANLEAAIALHRALHPDRVLEEERGKYPPRPDESDAVPVFYVGLSEPPDAISGDVWACDAPMPGHEDIEPAIG